MITLKGALTRAHHRVHGKGSVQHVCEVHVTEGTYAFMVGDPLPVTSIPQSVKKRLALAILDRQRVWPGSFDAMHAVFSDGKSLRLTIEEAEAYLREVA